jgi:hypothetical protein
MRGAITPLPQYVFMAWCLVKHRDNFIFTLLWKDMLVGFEVLSWLHIGRTVENHEICRYTGLFLRISVPQFVSFCPLYSCIADSFLHVLHKGIVALDVEVKMSYIFPTASHFLLEAEIGFVATFNYQGHGIKKISINRWFYFNTRVWQSHGVLFPDLTHRQGKNMLVILETCALTMCRKRSLGEDC